MGSISLWFAGSQLVGWALLHFLWQGALIGLFYLVLRSALPRGAARYRLGVGTLFALALCPPLTLWRLLDQVPDMMVSSPLSASTAVAGPGVAGAAGVAPSAFDALLPWLVLAWSLGVLLHLLRAWRQWRALKALMAVARSAPRWQRLATRMAQRFGLQRRVTVLVSRAVTTPVLFGWIKPVILLPMAVACGFPASQVELILAHELAHLRRWDPLAHLFQLALETLYFYHPVVRWISRDVSNEREICCDRLALTLGGGSRREFVTVLAELGELRERQNNLALAMSGGVLLDRVQLMMLPGKRAPQERKYAHAVVILLAAALVTLTLRLHWIQVQVSAGVDTTITRLQTLLLPVPLPMPATIVVSRGPSLLHMTLPAVAPLANDGGPGGHSTGTISLAALSQPVSTPVLVPAWSAPGMLAPSAAPIATVSPPAPAAPIPVYVRNPVYPQVAMQQGIEGEVVVEFSLTQGGSVRALRVISSSPAGVFEQSALDAVHFWKYAVPAGSVATQRYRQSVAFTLDRPRADRSHARMPITDLKARPSCQVVTGTHICRWLNESASPRPISRPLAALP